MARILIPEPSASLPLDEGEKGLLGFFTSRWVTAEPFLKLGHLVTLRNRCQTHKERTLKKEVQFTKQLPFLAQQILFPGHLGVGGICPFVYPSSP